MAVNESIDPVVLPAISQWPNDAPRGAVSTFCAEHGISRKSFYELRKRVDRWTGRGARTPDPTTEVVPVAVE